MLILNTINQKDNSNQSGILKRCHFRWDAFPQYGYRNKYYGYKLWDNTSSGDCRNHVLQVVSKTEYIQARKESFSAFWRLKVLYYSHR